MIELELVINDVFFLLDVNVSKGYYAAIMDMIDRFFDGDIDQQVFEEHSRYIFVTDAYLIFTIDKLVHSMVKQVKSSQFKTIKMQN
jgi:paired amphipathic helix protein Sin3a